jgi:hypothetical protein
MMFGMTLYLLCRGRSLHEVNYWNILRSCLLLIGSTAVSPSVLCSLEKFFNKMDWQHIASTADRAVHAFIIDAQQRGGPVGYLTQFVLVFVLFMYDTT